MNKSLVFSLILVGAGLATFSLQTALSQATEPTTKLSITNNTKTSFFSSGHYGVVGLSVKGSQNRKSYSRCLFSKTKNSCLYDVAANREVILAAVPQSKSDKVVWTGCDKSFSMKRSSSSKILPGRTIYGCKTTTSTSSGEKKVTVKFD